VANDLDAAGHEVALEAEPILGVACAHARDGVGAA
jgi:hypothetical protein